MGRPGVRGRPTANATLDHHRGGGFDCYERISHDTGAPPGGSIVDLHAVIALVAALLGLFPVAIVFGLIAYPGGRGKAVPVGRYAGAYVYQGVGAPKIADNRATCQSSYGPCQLVFQFAPSSVTITQNAQNSGDCGFGSGVQAGGKVHPHVIATPFA